MTKNRGGWPLRKKHIFDPAARRRWDRALGRLLGAKAHIERTRTELECFQSDPESADAWAILDQASVAVHEQFKQDNNTAATSARCVFCGEPEDGGQFGWFDDAAGALVCNRCGRHPQKGGR